VRDDSESARQDAPTAAPKLPLARGPLSASVVEALRRPPGPVVLPVFDVADPLADDDLHLALACCYELHYRSFGGVDPGWEWAPALLDLRARLERVFARRLVEEIGAPRALQPRDVVPALEALTSAETGPSLSAWMLAAGTREQMRELCVHRSAYQLKEADPHTWTIPRLRGRAKTAMVEIQRDEYGAGDPAAVHARLFATTMRSLDLDDAYGAYLDVIPGTTLATVNLVTMFGLHRRWRGAAVGHLAVFEMTSVEPMRRYSEFLDRLGADDTARRFYDEHVAVDAVHEQVALHEMVTGLVDDEPELAGDVVFGARALVALEHRFTDALLGAWSAQRSSLVRPLAPSRERRAASE
jgi:hypothetical protein